MHMSCMCVCVHAESLSCVRIFATPWTVARQALLSMEFSRQEDWNGLPFPTPRGSSQPRDQTHISCISIIGRLILDHCAPWGAVTDQNNRWIIDMDVMEMLGRENVCFWQFSPKEWAICLVLLLRINLKP